jgi:hypothetical protein
LSLLQEEGRLSPGPFPAFSSPELQEGSILNVNDDRIIIKV